MEHPDGSEGYPVAPSGFIQFKPSTVAPCLAEAVSAIQHQFRTADPRCTWLAQFTAGQAQSTPDRKDAVSDRSTLFGHWLNEEFTMNKLPCVAGWLFSAVLCAAAPSGLAGTRYEEAEVLASTPIYRVVEITTPQRECWEEEVARSDRRWQRDNSSTPELLGMVVGGAIGNAMGHRKINRQVGAVVGAVLGGSIAHDLSRQRRERNTVVTMDVVERCRTVSSTREEEKLVGYDVRYRYNGAEHTVRMDHEPGETLQMRVSAEPVL
jgi:uncharacterized protein YcfJ